MTINKIGCLNGGKPRWCLNGKPRFCLNTIFCGGTLIASTFGNPFHPMRPPPNCLFRGPVSRQSHVIYCCLYTARAASRPKS